MADKSEQIYNLLPLHLLSVRDAYVKAVHATVLFIHVWVSVLTLTKFNVNIYTNKHTKEYILNLYVYQSDHNLYQ